MLFKKTKPVMSTSLAGQYSECETVTAGPETPTHVRVLTEAGQKKSGGADTAALCGRVVSWDLSLITAEKLIDALPRQHATFRYCTACVEALTGLTAEQQNAPVAQ